MIDPNKYVIGSDEVVDVRDVDLDVEEIYLRDGRRLTNELADQLTAEALDEVRRRNLIPGRKSLTGKQGEESPRVQFRLPADLRAKAEERAQREGKTVSRLAREALERYLAS